MDIKKENKTEENNIQDEVTPRDINTERFRMLFALCVIIWLMMCFSLIMTGLYFRSTTAQMKRLHDTTVTSTSVYTEVTTTSVTTTSTTTSKTTTTTTTTTAIFTPEATKTSALYTESVYKYITYEDYLLLCNLVAREYGSDWVPVPEKAKVVATVMNRVKSDIYPDTIYEVVTQPNQFTGYIAFKTFSSNVTSSVREAVDYYFDHPNEFGSYLYFYGDGKYNYFY